MRVSPVHDRSSPGTRPARRLAALVLLAACLPALGACGRVFLGAEGGSASDTDWTVGLEL
ncbi:MAG: hypothetical protein RID91_20245 [Azospirillaceae bacterium]